jgi:SAM-dependent methyltransferase
MEHVATVVDRLAASFAARPYMPQDAFGAQRDLDKPMGFGLDVQAGASSASVPDFEELLRGSEEFVAERQRAYLPLFDGLQEVVDLGSGRGEFLTLLRERGIRAVGVELNEKLVARCYARGLAVECADALDYLESRAEQSLDAIFSAQFIEHVPSNRLSELLQLGHSKLRHGGIFVAETVNSEGNQALRTSHVDPTHQRPIDPQVLLYLCQQAGFLSGRILYPVNGGLTQHAYAQAGYYALVGLR